MAELNVGRRGWCPSVWSPMESGDGLLLRVRARRGRWASRQLRGLALAARTFGNGIVDATRRASLQMRGVSWSSLPDLQAELARLGLASASAAEERRLEIAVCPTAGLDARCPALEQLADSLEPVLWAPELEGRLSDKFLLLVSGGSDLFNELEVDLRVELRASHPERVLLSVAAGARSHVALGACGVEAATRVVHQLLVLLGATPGTRPRMRDLVNARGIADLFAALEPLGLQRAAAPREPPWQAHCLGFHTGIENWFAFELPFGSGDAAQWDAIAELSERFGRAEVRLLPGHVLLLPGVRELERELLASLAAQNDFIVERPLPALRLLACSGAPACRSAHAETRRLATDLGALLRARLTESTTLHVSGCEKSCAWGGPADITLVHGADGCRLGFGTDVAQTSRAEVLTIDAVRERLRMRSS